MAGSDKAGNTFMIEYIPPVQTTGESLVANNHRKLAIFHSK